MFLVALISIGLMAGLWAWEEIKRFQRDSAAIRIESLHSYREMIRSEVREAVDYIEYMKAQTDRRLKSSIKARIYEAHSIADHIYREYKDEKPPAEIRRLIKEALRPIRFNHGRGYLFITNLEGIEELFADRPEMEGRDMLGVQGGKGEFVVRDMIEIVKSRGEGFYRYYWSKPNRQGNEFPKIAFVKLFEPYDWLIGAGEYLDDVTAEIQEEVLARLSTIRFGKDGYIFIGRWDGVSLGEPGKGKNMLGVTDVNGVGIVREIIDRAKSGGGFVSYIMPRFKGLKPASKISYAEGIPDWEWYVGAGVYIDDIEATIENNRKKEIEKITLNIVSILGILIGLILLVFLAAQRTARKARVSYESFSRFLDQASRDLSPVDPGAMRYEEFVNLAHSANLMVESRRVAEDALRNSEEKYRLIVENQNDLVVKFDRDNKLLFVSPSYCEMFGRSEKELLEQSFLPLIHRDDRQAVLETMIDLKRPPFSCYHEERAMTIYGWRWLAWSNRAILGDDGRPITFIGVGRDVTERNQAVEALKEGRAWLKNVLESIQAGVMVVDVDTYTILDVNRAAAEMIGISKDEILHSNYRNFIYRDVDERGVGTDSDLAMEGKEHFLLRADGKKIPILKTGNQAVINNTAYLIESFLDISETKRLEANLHQSQKMEAVGTLAGGIAHDFNNLLQAITGYTQIMLLDRHSKDPEYPTLQAIQRSSERAAQLVRQLLLFSRKAETERRPVDLNHELEQAGRILERTIPKMVDIEMHFGSRLWKVMADPVQIEQILLNLGGNSADAMPEGGVLILETRNITLDTEFTGAHTGAEPGDYVLLVVADNGQGMDDETVAHIYEPFFTTKDIGRGTGLGLASVYGIVKSYNGHIDCQSEPGQGTIFKIYLPAIGESERNKETDRASGPIEGGTETILLVDDEASIRNFARQALERFGYSVISAASGEEALDVFSTRGRDIDLVIMDIGMPGMGGRRCFQEILRVDPLAKIVVASGYSIDDQLKKMVKAGAVEYIGKPYELNDLLGKIRSVLER